MAEQRQFTLQVPHSGRQGTDFRWEVVEPKYINAWQSACECFRERKIIANGASYTVSVDLNPILRRHQRFMSAMSYLHRDDGRHFSERIMKTRFPRKPSINVLTISTDSKNAHCLSVAESTVYDLFAIMNIAAPGCCDFYRASLLGDRIEPDVSLGNSVFESALYVHLTEGWPVIRYIDVKDVLIWFESIRTIASQIPSNAMERTVFALFYLSKIDMSPIEVIWLFYAFESLLQTKSGENFSSIVTRLCLLLDADERQAQFVRKKMRELYDIRSAIVHGGLEATHPMHDAGIDDRAEESFMRIMRATKYGHAFLISAIQKTILNGWRFPIFSETLDGIPIANGAQVNDA